MTSWNALGQSKCQHRFEPGHTRAGSAGTEFARSVSGATGWGMSAGGRARLRPCWNGESVVAGDAVATTTSSGCFVDEVAAWPGDGDSGADSSEANGRVSWRACNGSRARRDLPM